MRAGRDGGVVQLPPVQQRSRVLADVETVEGWSWCGESAVSPQLREYPWNEAVHMERDDVGEALDLLLRVDVNGREARIEDLDDAHVLVHEGEWDQRIIGIWIRERGAGRPDQMSNISQ